MRYGSSVQVRLTSTLAVLVLATALSGCIAGDHETPPIPETGLENGAGIIMTSDGRDLRTELTAADSLPAPVWEQGDWWGIHFYFGSDPGEGRHINTVVTEADDGGYFLATDDRDAAKIHAINDLPILGAVTATDLSVTAFGGAWDLIEFPLSHNATWTGEIPNIAFDVLPDGQVPLTFTAEFTEDIDVGGETVPGYAVTGVTDNGTVVINYTYAPAVGWITSATIYDIDPGQDPIEFSLTLMGHGEAWTGTYYIDEAEMLVANFDGSGFTDEPTDGGGLFVDPSPSMTFTVSEDAHYLFGFIVNVAFVGARVTVLSSPDGESRSYEAVGAPGQGVGTRIDEAAVAGEWRIVTSGAGALSYSEIMLAEIVETVGEL